MSKIQVNEIVNHFDTGAPDCPKGLTVTGFSTFTGGASYSGSVSIGGTLTYEDVNNIDSVGVITARSGIDIGVSGGGSNTFLDNIENGHLNIINSGRQANNGRVRINKTNDAGGDTTYFRDFEVYDGKDNLLLLADGSSGNIGIGTDNPNNPLTVYGSGNHIFLKDTATDNNLQIRSSGGVAQFNSYGTGGARRDFVFNQYTTEVLRITSSGNVGIGSNIPAEKLDVNGGLKVYANTNIATFKNNQLRSDAAGTYYFDHGTTGQSFTFRTSTSSSLDTTGPSVTSAGNISFPSGKGIDFSATSDGGTSTPSELLDDYEEGSWNPQILGWNGSYSIQEGRYIKIGRKVHLIGEVRTDATTGSSFNTWPGLSNLPFVNTTSFQGVSGSQRNMGYATMLGDISPGGTNGQGFVTFDRNTGTAFFPNHISSAGAQNFSNGMINNITTVDFGYRFNCTYYTD